MERLKKSRTPLRAALTRTFKEVDAELQKNPCDLDVLREKLRKLEDFSLKTFDIDKQVLDGMLDALLPEDEYLKEAKDIEDYEDGVRRATLLINRRLVGTKAPFIARAPEVDQEDEDSLSGSRTRRSFQLPKIKPIKFSGDMKEWLSWSSQFMKIHQDDELHTIDKFSYLLQSMVEGSRAHRVVSGYPLIENNYLKALQALEERFGDRTLLTELYVRQLSRLVIKNASNKKLFCISTMYDELDSSIRALDTLGVTIEQSAAFLYPLVESSLPEDLLRVWQRSSLSGYQDEEEGQKVVGDRLKSLMTFLKREVKGAERLAFVSSEIDGGAEKKESPQSRRKVTQEDIPTAAGLYVGEKPTCVFCDNRHDSKECGRTSTMTLQDKKKKLETKRACFSCFRVGHGSKKCTAFVRCVICDKSHHVFLCPELSRIKETAKESQESPNPHAEALNSLSACTHSGTVLLQTLRLKISGPKETKVVRALIDSGSQRSYVLETTAMQLGLPTVRQQEMVQSYFGGGTSGVKTHNVHKVTVGSVGGTASLSLELIGQNKICNKLPHIPRGQLLSKLRRMKIWVSDLGPEPSKVEVLLGADCAAALLNGNVKRVSQTIVAVETTLGWTLMGRTADNDDSLAAVTVSTCMESSELKRLWDLESLGIMDPIQVMSQQQKDSEAKESLVKSMRRNPDGRYVIKLPWVDREKTAPHNLNVAVKRLESTTAKLVKTGSYKVYNQVFSDWQKEGLVEIADPAVTRSHYLPHRPVFKPESVTTPVRPVFDASCKQGRMPSLNDCLSKGPNLIELLPSILMRFRQRRVGVVADIRKAYQMIEVDEGDRDFLRFLWRTEDGMELHLRHSRVVFGVNCSAFILGAVLEYHLGNVCEEERPVASKLLSSMYVDNSVLSLDSIEDMEEFKLKSTEILARAQMDLRQREWASVLGIGHRRGWSLSRGSPSNGVDSVSSVLGLRWDKATDELFCDIPEFSNQLVITKRNILSTVAKIFDPMGILSPATLFPKILLQRSWKKNKAWDEEIDLEDKQSFIKWIHQVRSLQRVRVPRFAFPGVSESWSIQLHTFCDASKDAYAAAVFVRIEKSDGEDPELLFLQGKSRVAPLHNPTIPRLELLSCLVGARVTKNVVDSLNLLSIPRYYWTDSAVALAWIQRNDEWGTYVGNRVKEINVLSSPEDWRHVPGESNPADLPSRGCSPSQLLQSRWWEGPNWLKKRIETWPVTPAIVDEEMVTAEKKKSAVRTHTHSAVSTGEQTKWYLQQSSYQKNLRIVAWILRFIDCCKKTSNSMNSLSAEDLERAEMKMFQLVQSESFPTHDDMVGGLRVRKCPKGLLRVHTKLLHRPDSADFKAPILLPSVHPLVNQLVRYEHEKNCHAGAQFLVCRLRERLWILRSRRTIKGVLKKCVVCKRHSAKPVEVDSAPLPLDRVKSASAFEVTGVDLAGPLFLKGGDKAWIVIFTCAVYRCVHFELVSSLSTEAFLMALQKFICRRGRPSIIYSDNGTNFRGADNLFESLQWEEIEKYAGTQRIAWKFNPPSAAWWGGFWERLIRSSKDLLKRMLGHKKLNFNSLESCLCEVESVLNGRPLTYVSEDQDDLTPLTPEMFTNPLKQTTFPEQAEVDGRSLRTKVKALGQLREELRVRFREEYLSQLVHRGKTKTVTEVKAGDVVLVGSDLKKRLMWPMGRIVELIVGADGKTRVARVRVKDGVVTRPLQRLFPLEISTESDLPPKPTPVTKHKTSEPEEIVVTRIGRQVKKPQRLGIN